MAWLSLALMLWQWVVARRFRLHQRSATHLPEPAPGLTLLKPLKGCDQSTEDCLRSWFKQAYPGRVQILFGVASAEDPICGVVRKLQTEFPSSEAQLVVCGPLRGANAKVSKLAELEQLAKHELLVVSDADVRVPADLLANLAVLLNEKPDQEENLGLVSCFYQMANPTTLAMRWEAMAINADFWSQVLQSRSLKPIDFALGAVMALQRQALNKIGGFAALSNCLADDYQLGHRIARCGYDIGLCPVVVECWSEPMGWKAVWKHQTRWARTIRVCQPAPYFFSILSNPTLWPLLWLWVRPGKGVLALALSCCALRIWMGLDLQWRLTQVRPRLIFGWLAPFKDLLQAAIWLSAFMGNRVEWRGERMTLRSDGTLVKEQ